MQYVGSRNEPSIKDLLVIVLIVLVAAIYAIISLATGDWRWWNPRFDHTPSGVVVHCFGKTTQIDPGSNHFRAIETIVNASLSGPKRWDSLSLSEATYHDYQTHPNMVAVELFYPQPVRVHSNYKYFSNVDNIIIPLVGRHAQTGAIFGRNQDLPAAGSLHVENKGVLTDFLTNQGICLTSMSSP